MRSVGRLVLAVAFAFNTPAAGAKNGSSIGRNPLDNKFANFVKNTMDLVKVPGLAIAVIDGSSVFTQGYGIKNVAKPDEKCTPDTLFYAGSTTKAQTAAMMSMLIHENTHPELANNWSTTLTSIIGDDFVYQDEWQTEHMTLDDLVCHRHGLARQDQSLMREKDMKPLSLRDMVRNTRNLPDPVAPRTEVSYSNYGYLIISYVIEKISKKELKEVLKEQLWQQLGMNSTYFGLQDARDHAQDRLAAGHLWRNGSQSYKQATYMPLTDLSGAAAVISSVKDYAHWIKALLTKTLPFSADVQSDIREPRMLSSPTPGNVDIVLYGLGWYRSTYKGHVVYYHDGSMIGFKSQVWWFPDDNYGIVSFTNSDSGDDANQIIGWKLIADRFGIPEKDRFNQTRSYLENVQTPAQRYDNAVQKLYPNHQMLNATTKPSFSREQLVGTYSSEGYGNMTLRTQGVDTLVAERPEMTWMYGITFSRIYGDHWMGSGAWLDDMSNPGAFHPVEFTNGTNGMPGAMKIRWQQLGGGEANVTFSRV
ncbi:hypothetical protein L249_1706 [Ophiocordyceps polyrhachis-furcata BCC 54312]|uniref:Beta-lactamase-related domain-containing protein n=1 Tax=Ophiocordyceps polyrhachis-furcata BCC 54312 TaxID=1330021 RepID=A0A367LN86_9HYPO|nr:hypothetical protein L249_1706 [Ophiocordyceps polyrhachis-furcata BCC 54312]